MWDRDAIFASGAFTLPELLALVPGASVGNGAFISVTTFMTRDTTSAWTHMRVFVLRDSAQLRELSAKLDAAGVKLEPDSAKRRLRGEYSATLRERVGAQMAHILR